MATGTRERPERLASAVSGRAMTGPGTKSAGPGADAKRASNGKKSKKLKLIIGFVLLVVVGAALKFTVLAPSSSAGATPAKPQPGPVIQMDEMTLNLTDGHYLRMKIALQTTKGTSEEFDTSEAAQLIIDQFSNRTVTQLTGDVARQKMMAGLVAKLQSAYPKKIIGGFYTEFVMTG